MQFREFALGIINSPSLDKKLSKEPHNIVDTQPGPGVSYLRPKRMPALAVRPAKQVKVPPASGMRDPSQRARIVHALANHELQAVELFAWALLAFPDSPPAFRKGLLHILGEEQDHCQAYRQVLHRLDKDLGDFPVTGHFWHHLPALATPLQFVCTMGLTFENANLDFALEYAKHAKKAGDDLCCQVLERVHAEEIRHVAFAWRWFTKLRDPSLPAFDCYKNILSPPLGPQRARGKDFDHSSRERAGIDNDFIGALANTEAKRPSGASR